MAGGDSQRAGGLGDRVVAVVSQGVGPVGGGDKVVRFEGVEGVRDVGVLERGFASGFDSDLEGVGGGRAVVVVVIGNRFQEIPLEGGAGVPSGHALPPAREVFGERCDSSWVAGPLSWVRRDGRTLLPTSLLYTVVCSYLHLTIANWQHLEMVALFTR